MAYTIKEVERLTGVSCHTLFRKNVRIAAGFAAYEHSAGA